MDMSIILDIPNSDKIAMFSNSQFDINEMPLGNRSFMNYLPCHSETEQLSIPDSKSKKNDITLDCNNLELSLLLTSTLNKSCHMQQINTCNISLYDSTNNNENPSDETADLQVGRPSLQSKSGFLDETHIHISLWLTKGDENVILAEAGIQTTDTLDSRLHGNDKLVVFSDENQKADDFISHGKDGFNYASNKAADDSFSHKSYTPNTMDFRGIAVRQTVQTDDPQTEIKSSVEGMAKNYSVKGTQEINAKEMLKVMPESIMKDLTKSHMPDTFVVNDSEIAASNISGTNKTPDESTNLRKGYETHMLYGSTNDNEDTLYPYSLPQGEKRERQNALLQGDKELNNLYPLTGAGNEEGEEIFSDENQKAGDFISHGKDRFNNAVNTTAEDGFSHMFSEHSQNKNNPAASEIAAVARRIADMSGNRFHITSKDATSVEVSVEPEEIGRLDIKLSLDKDAVKARITAFEHVGKEIIEKNIHNIIDSLIKEGINIGSFSVALKERREQQNCQFNKDEQRVIKVMDSRPQRSFVSDNNISIFV